MNKKTLGIILVVSIVVVAGLVYLGYQKGLFTKEGIGGIGEKSVMDTAREQGQIVPSKTDAIKECGKETDQGEKDTCYGILAFYYRDASFCKYVKDPEMKSKCTKENIEKWYSGGSTSPFMPGLSIPGGGTLPGGGIIPSGEPAQPEPTTEGQEKPIISGKMTDEIYIEIAAQAAYHYGRGDSTDWASHGEMDLLAKYGVTGENIIAYAEALKEDPSHAQAIAPKFQQRLQELQKTGK